MESEIWRKSIRNQSSRQKSVKILYFAVILIFFLLPPLSAEGQQAKANGLKIGILPVANRTQLDYIDNLVTTVEDNILFTATQLGNYTIIDGRTEKLTDPKQLNRLKRIAKSKKCHYLIAGQVTQAGGTYTLTLILYDAREGKIKAMQDAPFFKLIDAFAVTDRLSISLLEQLIGERIKRGTIYFVNQTPGTTFSVSVNRKKLEENSPSVTLIEGTYKIRIYNTTKGRKKVLTQKVEIKEGVPLRINIDLSQKNISYDKKNTIRTNPYGMVILFGNNSNDSDNVSGGGFMMPAFSYTRLFTDKVGLNIAIASILSPNDESEYMGLGVDIRVGPYFRIGRLGITPMLGIGMNFYSYDLSIYSLTDFINKKEIDGDASLLVVGELVIGFEFFFTPMFSVYMDVGFSFANNQRLDSGDTDNSYTQEIIAGFTTAVGLGVSF